MKYPFEEDSAGDKIMFLLLFFVVYLIVVGLVVWLT